MKIIEYKNLSNEDMVLILDEENDKAESMPKSVYEERQAALAEQTKPTK